MNIVATLVKLADILDGVDENVVNDEEIIEPVSHLDANSKRFLKNAANYVALNMGDGSDIVSKSIEYMRVGYGDDYYDFATLERFFSLASTAMTFSDLRSIGLNDVVFRLNKSVNDLVDSDEDFRTECETYIVRSFGQICVKYRGKSISAVVKLAWTAYSGEISNLVDSFFSNRFDCGKIIARNIDVDGGDGGEDAVFKIVKSQALAVWKSYYFNASEIAGSAIRFLSLAGFSENAYNRSVDALLAGVVNAFKKAWVRLTE